MAFPLSSWKTSQPLLRVSKLSVLFCTCACPDIPRGATQPATPRLQRALLDLPPLLPQEEPVRSAQNAKERLLPPSPLPSPHVDPSCSDTTVALWLEN